MKNLKIIDYNDLKQSNKLDEYLVNSCLRVCNNSSFLTDYNDVYDHLFGNKNYFKLFLIDNNLEIKGFLVSDLFNGYNNNLILHCHGLIVDKDYQDKGYGKRLVETMIKKYNPDVITMKTHNPRCFELFTSFPYTLTYYPNLSYEIPKDILSLVKKHPFLNNVNSNLVYEGAYPDIKVWKNAFNKDINKIFMNIDDYDAQAIVVVRHDDKLDLKCQNILQKKKY